MSVGRILAVDDDESNGRYAHESREESQGQKNGRLFKDDNQSFLEFDCFHSDLVDSGNHSGHRMEVGQR